MDEWNTNKLPERLPFSKKRLPKRVIFRCVALDTPPLNVALELTGPCSYILDYVIIL